MLNFDGSTKQDFTVTVEGGQRISFAVDLVRNQEGSPTGAQVSVAIAETASSRIAAGAARRILISIFGETDGASPLNWWKPFTAFAVLTLLLAGAWWVWTNRHDQTEVVRVSPTPAPTAPPVTPGPPQQNREEPQRTTLPPVNRSPESVIAPAATPLLAQRQSSNRERDESFVARSLVAGDNVTPDPGELSTRGAWNRQLMGKPLPEVSRVYLQAIGDNALNQELLNEVRARLAAGGALQDSGSDQADAALKISVRPASSRADDLRVSVIVRAVNANGYVVWPGSSGGSGWRYVGQPRFVAERIVADLTKDIRSGK